MFGTQMTDEFFAAYTGGDIAFLNGVLKTLLAEGGVDREFVREHTVGFDALLEELEQESFKDLEAASGATRDDMQRFARMYASANAAVLVWSMGITQHASGSETVSAIVNLALARGNVGREGAGLMPIRGHSGVQGGAEMGAYATAFPGGVAIDEASAKALTETYGFPVGTRVGLTAEEMIETAARRGLEVLYSSGGNFLDVLPGSAAGRRRTRAGPGAGAPGHRRVEPDARGPERRRRAAARVHALRTARRRHGDHHRAPHRVQPGDRRPADR